MVKYNYQRPHLYDLQQKMIDCPARYTIVEASTKTGKTVACLIWLFERALAGENGHNFWWVAPVQHQAQIAYRRLKRWLLTSALPKQAYKSRDTDASVEFAHGSRLWFKSADHPDSLYGEDVHAAVIDEASRCKQAAWHAVRSTLTATRGPLKIIGNVRGRRNWAWQMARQAESGAPEMAYFKMTAFDAVDAGILQKDEVEDARRALPHDVFEELYLAQASDDGGNPFNLQAIRACTSTQSTMAPDSAVVFGVDLAKARDWSVVCGLDAGGSVVCLERWQCDWRQTRERVMQIIGQRPALIDSTGVGDPIVEDLQRHCPNVTGFKFTSTSRQQLLEGLAAAIGRNELTLPDGWLIRELESFEYQYTRHGVRYAAPAGLHDDGVMALALAQRHRSGESAFDVRVF